MISRDSQKNVPSILGQHRNNICRVQKFNYKYGLSVYASKVVLKLALYRDKSS